MENFKDESNVAPFCSPYGVPLNLHNMYAGGYLFITFSGPSLLDNDLNLLKSPGITTMGVNNTPVIFRPNLWTCVDSPDRFMRHIWYDPNIMKFIDHTFFKMFMWDNKTKDIDRKLLVGGCPNIVGYCKRHQVNPTEWLDVPFMDWGLIKQPYKSPDGSTYPGQRSVFLVALKIAFLLGFRRVFLLGCDFNMKTDKPYAWSANKTEKECNFNNNTYLFLNAFLRDVSPTFEKFDFQVYNCNKNSGLYAFPYLPYEEAILEATKDMSAYLNEPVDDMYMKLNDKIQHYNVKIKKD